MDFRPVFFVLGILLSTLALSMMVPMLADLAVGHRDWITFAISGAFTLFVGVSLLLTNRMAEFTLSIRQAFLLTTLAWLVTATFAAVPLALAAIDLSYTDAFFEAMSGITTTGATVIVGLDMAPPGILLWRALLQWMGGIGIIVLALSVLPMLQVGGMQLFRTESSEKSDKVLPRAAQLATWIGSIYLIFTALCAVGYRLAGMEWFDAFAHAMTTIATGGFSTADASVAFFDDPLIELVGVIFMLAGALPFVLYLRALRGHLRPLLTDQQVRWFIVVVTSAVAAMTAHLWLARGYEPLIAFRMAGFNVVSVITGTGYATSDFGTWGSFAGGLMFFLMFVGGCAGSTTCGIKIFRFQVLYATADAQMRRLIQPHGVFIAYYNGKPIPEAVSVSVMSFFFLYALCFVVLSLTLQLLGLDYLTAMTGAATAISNVGPGLGPVIGPSGTFAPLPDAAKWVLAGGMLMGRLELFTVLILLTPAFWRQ
ncbi:potassium transporter TrkH [Skermanella stibiiresistens SB22]|uniref:Trk system potassium uptake protein n=1 Tax=Skermanella stibiiresistens SB22 TaxID=1385369 RepID=W9GWZ5_9PROT|nr:potassium transporter TrkH [Skermanella stibiiresistens SB22]